MERRAENPGRPGMRRGPGWRRACVAAVAAALPLAGAAMTTAPAWAAVQGDAHAGLWSNNHPSSPTVTSSTLPSGVVGAPYRARLHATGGVRPYTWFMVGGFLPYGLRLNAATGTIHGTPVRRGTYKVTVLVRGHYGGFGLGRVTITIAPPRPILRVSLANLGPFRFTRIGLYRARVTNVGKGTVAHLSVRVRLGAGLTPLRMNRPGWMCRAGGGYWTDVCVKRTALGPGGIASLYLPALVVARPGTRITSVVRVTPGGSYDRDTVVVARRS